jgi:hypothetical protein
VKHISVGAEAATLLELKVWWEQPFPMIINMLAGRVIWEEGAMIGVSKGLNCEMC